MKHLLLFVYCFYLNACLADISSDTVYLTWVHEPDTTMTIQWLSEKEKCGSGIDFRNVKSDVWFHAEGISNQLTSEKNVNYTLHHVELTHLEPSENYEFKITGVDTKRQLFFRTMPHELTHPIHFVAGGDMYHDNTTMLMSNTCKLAAASNPDFAVLGGDIAYAVKTARSKESLTRWIDWIKTWNSCMVTESGRLIPVIAAIGNHDLEGHFNQTPQHAKIFCLLFPRANDCVYGTLDFGSYMTLFLLDSGHANPIEGKQTAWLKSALNKRQDVDHRFAVYHVPAYPSVRSYTNEKSTAIRNNWVPIFEKEGLHIAFEHHDHAYKRTFPLLENKAHADGIVYLGDGAWSVDHPRSKLLNIKPPYLANFAASRHFISVQIHPDGLRHFRSISDEGRVLDDYKHRTPQKAMDKIAA